MSFSTFMRQCAVVLFHSLLLIVPLVFTWSNEELFEFPKMVLVYAFTALITGVWLCRMVAEKRWVIRKTVFDWPILIFLASQFLATVFSIHPRTSMLGYYTRFHGGLLSTISYTLLYYAFVNNVTKSQLKGFYTTLMISALSISLYAIPEHFGHSPSCALISGTFDVSCWVQDVQTRVFGTFGQPNWLAAYTITLLPLMMVLSSYAKKWYLWYPTALTLFLALIFSRSRSGFIGFALSMFVLVAGHIVIRAKKYGLNPQAWLTRSTGAFMVVGLTLLAALIVYGSPFTPALLSTFAETNSPNSPPRTPTPTPPTANSPVNRLDEGGTDSGEIRKIVWTGAIAVWQRYPLFGSGAETFAYSYYQDRPLSHNLVSEWDFLYNKAHNELLNFLATTGLVGLLSYSALLIWFTLTVCSLVVKKSSPATFKEKHVLVALLSGVTALSVSNFFGFSTVAVSVLLFLFLALVEVIKNPKEEHALSRPQTGGQKISIGVIMVVVCWLLVKIWTIWSADHHYYLGKQYFEAQYALRGIEFLQQAIKEMPNEALYHDELSTQYAQLAVYYHQQQQPTQSAQLGAAAIEENDRALALNSRHLNFYKTRVRVFILLAEIQPTLMNNAKQALEDALLLAPTDAKLVYNLGAIQTELNQVPEAMATFKNAIAMKPNYESARVELAKLYEKIGDVPAARAQYQYVFDTITQSNQLVNDKLQALPK